MSTSKQMARNISGAHRPLIAMLFANDTWGGRFDWLLQGDDDTTFRLGQVADKLKNPHLPLLVGQRPATGRGHAGVFQSAERPSPNIDCCSSLDAACPVELPSRPLHYEARNGKLVQDGVCSGGHLHHECCAMRPSPTRPRRRGLRLHARSRTTCERHDVGGAELGVWGRRVCCF